MKISIFLLLILFLVQPIYAQKKRIDSLYKVAKKMAYAGQHAQARQVCYSILSQKSDYKPAQLLISRTYAWDKMFDSARVETNKILLVSKSNKDALLMSSDIELWDKRYDSVLHCCNIGLTYYPNDETFLLKKARALLLLERKEEAEKTIRTIFELYPGNNEAVKLSKELDDNGIWELTLDYDFYVWKEPTLNRLHYFTSGLKFLTNDGTITPKIHLAKKITDTEKGWENIQAQYELLAYPKLWNKAHTRLNYAFSPNVLFPRHKFGFDLFQSLFTFETTFGFRYLQLVNDNRDLRAVTFAAISINKYYKNLWVSFRPYMVFKGADFKHSYNFTVHHFFNNSTDNYASLVVGTGNSPDEPINNVGRYEQYQLNNYMAKVGFQKRLLHNLKLKAQWGMQRKEYLSDTYKNDFLLDVSLGIDL